MCALLLTTVSAAFLSCSQEATSVQSSESAGTPVQIPNLLQWELISDQNGVLQKQKTLANEISLRFCADYSAISEQLGETYCAKDDVLLELLGQWFAACTSYQVSLLPPLFSERAVETAVFQNFRELGLQPEEAMDICSRVCFEVFAFQSHQIEFTVTGVTFAAGSDTSEYRRLMENLNQTGAEAEAEIEKIVVYELDNVLHAETDGRFALREAFEDSPVFYQTGGQWYLDPGDCPRELFSDLLPSDKEAGTHFYETAQTSGTVVCATDGYLCVTGLSGTKKYFRIEQECTFQVGERVSIEYYSMSLQWRGTFLADGSPCEYGIAVSVQQEPSLIVP